MLLRSCLIAVVLVCFLGEDFLKNVDLQLGLNQLNLAKGVPNLISLLSKDTTSRKYHGMQLSHMDIRRK